MLFLPTDGTGYTEGKGLALGIVLLILNLIFVSLYLIAWIMPDWLKTYLNHNYKTADIQNYSSEKSEDELLKELMED